MKISMLTSTDGNGLWSDESRWVLITGLEIAYVNDEEDFTELRAYFDLDSWDPSIHGLIYTDQYWMEKFRSGLIALGFTEEAANDVDYSEQGMQGDDYVSMDACVKFYNEWKRMSQ